MQVREGWSSEICPSESPWWAAGQDRGEELTSHLLIPSQSIVMDFRDSLGCRSWWQGGFVPADNWCPCWKPVFWKGCVCSTISRCYTRNRKYLLFPIDLRRSNHLHLTPACGFYQISTLNLLFFSWCLPQYWVMNSSLWFQREYNSLWMLFLSYRLWKARGQGGLIHCVSNKGGSCETTVVCRGKGSECSRAIFVWLLGECPGHFSWLCRVWWSANPCLSDPVCPGKQSRGATLGSETFLVNVSAPQTLRCHCHSSAAGVGKSSFRDSWGQQECGMGANIMLRGTETHCAACFGWIYANIYRIYMWIYIPFTWLGLLWFLFLGMFFCLVFVCTFKICKYS